MTELPPSEPQYLSYASPENRAGNGLAIGSMVCGICSIPLMLCAWYIGIPAAIVAVVLGCVARSKAKRGLAQGRAMALAGILCGSGALLLALALIGVLVAFVYTLGRNPAWLATPGPTTSPTVVVNSAASSTPPTPAPTPTTR